MELRSLFLLEDTDFFRVVFDDAVVTIASDTHVIDSSDVDGVIDVIEVRVEVVGRLGCQEYPDLADTDDTSAIREKFQVLVGGIADMVVHRLATRVGNDDGLLR